MPDESRYELALPPVDTAAMRRAAAQGQFLKENADLISPWAFTLPQHIERYFARLNRSWGEAKVKAHRA